MMSTLLFLLAIPAVYLIYILLKRKKTFPPGPFSWPVVGNLLQLGDEPYRTITKMRDIYGDIIGIQFGSKQSIFINDLKLIKEAFGLNALSSRPSLKHFLHPETGKRRGLIYTVGSEWVEQRRFVLRNLRDFGFGKSSMEMIIMEDVLELIGRIRGIVGQPVSTHPLFSAAVVNSLWRIVAGERYNQDDPKIAILLQLINNNMTFDKVLNIILPYPFLSYLAPNLSGHNKYMKNLIPVHNFIQESINDHKETYQEGERRDLIDCYIEEINKAPSQSSFHGTSGDQNMMMGIYELFFGGSETTGATLTWICFILAHFLDVQDKLYEKIKEAIGTSKIPSLTDKPNLPYVEAFVMEVMRFSTLAPFGVVHSASEEINFHGYIIPKGTYVFGNQFAVMQDPLIWGDPENFRPERFLTSDEKTVLNHEALIPFSIGKRICPAETMAKDQLFLFTASLFQRLKVRFPSGIPIPKVNESVYAHFVVAPKSHRVIFSERN